MRSYNINLLGFNLPKKKNPSIIILPSTSFPLQSSSLLPAGAWTNDIKRSTEIGIRLWFWSTIVFISVCVCVCDQSLVISWLLDELYGGRLGGLYRRRETKKKKRQSVVRIDLDYSLPFWSGWLMMDDWCRSRSDLCSSSRSFLLYTHDFFLSSPSSTPSLYSLLLIFDPPLLSSLFFLSL